MGLGTTGKDADMCACTGEFAVVEVVTVRLSHGGGLSGIGSCGGGGGCGVVVLTVILVVAGEAVAVIMVIIVDVVVLLDVVTVVAEVVIGVVAVLPSPPSSHPTLLENSTFEFKQNAKWRHVENDTWRSREL